MRNAFARLLDNRYFWPCLCGVLILLSANLSWLLYSASRDIDRLGGDYSRARREASAHKSILESQDEKIRALEDVQCDPYWTREQQLKMRELYKKYCRLYPQAQPGQPATAIGAVGFQPVPTP